MIPTYASDHDFKDRCIIKNVIQQQVNYRVSSYSQEDRQRRVISTLLAALVELLPIQVHRDLIYIEDISLKLRLNKSRTYCE